jgi:hypothetical protein
MMLTERPSVDRFPSPTPQPHTSNLLNHPAKVFMDRCALDHSRPPKYYKHYEWTCTGQWLGAAVKLCCCFAPHRILMTTAQRRKPGRSMQWNSQAVTLSA